MCKNVKVLAWTSVRILWSHTVQDQTVTRTHILGKSAELTGLRTRMISHFEKSLTSSLDHEVLGGSKNNDRFQSFFLGKLTDLGFPFGSEPLSWMHSQSLGNVDQSSDNSRMQDIQHHI